MPEFISPEDNKPKLVHISVFVKVRFEGFHRWKDAPEVVSFLRNWHRHIFHVQLMVDTEGDNREIEFFILQREVKAHIKDRYEGRYFESSCEMIAKDILLRFGGSSCSVSEDGENGAMVVNNAPVTITNKIIQDSKVSAEPIKKKVTELVRRNPFIGTEAEGPHRGETVLFIPGCVTELQFNQVRKELLLKDQLRLIDRVYYGAGNITARDAGTLHAIINKFYPNKIDVEIDKWDNVPDPIKEALGIYSLITVIGKDIDRNVKRINYFKWHNETHIIWKPSGMGSAYKTSIDDPLFAQDKEIVLTETTEE